MYSRSDSSIVIAPTSLFADLDGAHHARDRNAVREQLRRIDVDLILLLESADARDLRHARHGGERVAEIPVLHAPQLREVERSAGVLERVLVDPSQARGIGAERRRDASPAACP